MKLMKKTEKQELKNLSLEELAEKIELFRRELFSLKLHSATSPVKDNQQFKKIRKNIARTLTEFNKKCLSNQSKQLNKGKI